MSDHHVSTGDPRRSMELLWGRAPAPTRGPKPGLDLASIVATGIEIADADGLVAVSMRRIGERLGKSAMSLYTYVPGKAELLDLMLDSVYAEFPTVHDRTGGWRPALESVARATWTLYERHPWTIQIPAARPLLSPNEFAMYEAQLAAVDGIGLSGLEMTRVVAAVIGYVRGAIKDVADTRSAAQVTGVSDDEWWNARSPLLDEMAGDDFATPYPLISRLSEEQAFDQQDRADDDATPYLERDMLDTFEFGLQRLLDGVQTYVDSTDRPTA